MRQKEMIRLDARVDGVIADAVFRAEMSNGHRIVAYADRADRDRVRGLQAGQMVKVEMSPFDMSRGRIILEKQAEGQG